MPGKILELSFLLAAVMAVTLSVSVMGTIFPGPGKAHDGGTDSPSPAHDIMRKVWLVRGLIPTPAATGGREQLTSLL